MHRGIITEWRKRVMPVVGGVVNYYVDATGGNDANNGRSPEKAWQTVAKVNATAFYPGNHILFKRGETWAEKLTFPSSGTASNPINISNYGTGALPIITGSGVRDHAIIATAKNYITIDGITATATVWETIDFVGGIGAVVKNCTIPLGGNIGILVEGGATLFDIYSNVITGSNGNGIGTSGVSNGEIHHNDVSACGIVTDDRSCISVFGVSGNVRVHHNICHDSSNAGAAGIRGIILDTTGALVNYAYQNLCHHCDGSGIYVILSNNQQVYNNICYSNGSVGNWNDGIKWENCTGGLCYHNTCYGNRNSSIRCRDTASGVIIKNNIGWQTGNSCFIKENSANVHTVDYNNWYGVANEYDWNGVTYANEALFFAATGQGQHDFTTDPLCVSNVNYHLQAGSPCRGNGAVGLGIVDDYDSVVRASPPDIGAYQYV